MSALHEAFARARGEGRATLIGYLPSGFPSLTEGIALARAIVAAGVDVVEVGLPYSDPLMDGPVIQEAVHQALVGGSSVAHVLETVSGVAATGAPTLVMSYWNPMKNDAASASRAIEPPLSQGRRLKRWPWSCPKRRTDGANWDGNMRRLRLCCRGRKRARGSCSM